MIELRDHAQDLTNNLLTGFPSPRLQAAIRRSSRPTASSRCRPIFSASYSGLFKMFFDVLERDGLAGKPVLIGATGGSARHSLALEHAAPAPVRLPRGGYRPDRVFAAAEDWGVGRGRRRRRSVERIDRAARELATAVAARDPVAETSAFDDPVPFEDLLRASRPE